MEAVHTSETSVYSNETIWRYVREDSRLHAHCCENLESQKQCCSLLVGDHFLLTDFEPYVIIQ
jgi:hypothetical protein